MSSGFGRGPVPGAAGLLDSYGFSPRTVRLRLLNPHGAAKVEWPLQALTVLAGRSDGPLCCPEIDLGPYDAVPPAISRQHAELFWQDGKLKIVDLGSSNGTWLNGQRLASAGLRQPSAPTELRAGDRLRFGAIECQIIVST